MYLTDSDPIIKHVTISDNWTGEHGGGMSLGHSNPIMTYVNISWVYFIWGWNR